MAWDGGPPNSNTPGDYEADVANGASLTANISSLAPTEGDAIVICYGAFIAGGPHAAPTGIVGYTLLASYSESEGPSVWVWSKEAGASETDQTISPAIPGRQMCWSFVFPGDYNGDTIVDQIASDMLGGLDDSPRIIPTKFSSYVICLFWDPFVYEAASAPTGTQLINDVSFDNGNVQSACAYRLEYGTNPNGPFTWHNISGRVRHLTLNVLRPAAIGYAATFDPALQKRTDIWNRI